MKVIMKALITGTRNGEDWPHPGAVADLPDAEALHLLNAGLAAPAPVEPPIEAAVVDTTPQRRKARGAN